MERSFVTTTVTMANDSQWIQLHDNVYMRSARGMEDHSGLNVHLFILYISILSPNVEVYNLEYQKLTCIFLTSDVY